MTIGTLSGPDSHPHWLLAVPIPMSRSDDGARFLSEGGATAHVSCVALFGAAAHVTLPGARTRRSTLEVAQNRSTPFQAALERSTIETSVKHRDAARARPNRDAEPDPGFHQVALLKQILAGCPGS